MPRLTHECSDSDAPPPQAPWTPFQSAVDRGVRFTVTGMLKDSAGFHDEEELWHLQFRYTLGFWST